MDDQAQVVEVRRRRTRAEAEQLAGEYEGSGLSRVEFCRKHAAICMYHGLERHAAQAAASWDRPGMDQAACIRAAPEKGR